MSNNRNAMSTSPGSAYCTIKQRLKVIELSAPPPRPWKNWEVPLPVSRISAQKLRWPSDIRERHENHWTKWLNARNDGGFGFHEGQQHKATERAVATKAGDTVHLDIEAKTWQASCLSSLRSNSNQYLIMRHTAMMAVCIIISRLWSQKDHSENLD